MEGGDVARRVAVRHRDLRVLDGVPALAEGVQRRPTVLAVLALAQQCRGSAARASPQALQAAVLASPEALPEAAGAPRRETALGPGRRRALPRRPLARALQPRREAERSVHTPTFIKGL